MDNRVNCWDTLRASYEDWAISSQANKGLLEGSETSAWSLEQTVKHHERATTLVVEDIVRANTKVLEANYKQIRDNKLGLCDTANTGANVVGACFVDGSAGNTMPAIGMVMTRDITTELERDSSNRLTRFVATAKWGVAEVADTSGVPIVTDA